MNNCNVSFPEYGGRDENMRDVIRKVDVNKH